MSKKNEKQNAAEAKASAASANKEDKQKHVKHSKNEKKQKAKKDESKQWLEEELDGVELDSNSEADGLMKKAAERIETLQADVRE